MRSSRSPVAELAAALRRAGVAHVDDSALARSLYASDASLYRISPQLVVVPRHIDELDAVLHACRRHQVPLTMRGAGTSIAGNAIGPGVVVDASRHLTRIHEIDPDTQSALVEPGVVQASLQRAAAPYGLRFGPDPSTHNRATLGGMIGNNACGSRALGYGRTSDNILGLDVIAGTGQRLRLGAMPQPTTDSPLLDQLRRTVGQHLAVIRTEFGRFPRQISGYALEHLLPERGFDVARALVGSEGTLALTRTARVRLVREPDARILVCLGYPSMAHAADAVPAVLRHTPVACEGLDARIVNAVRDRKGPAAVPDLPRGEGWLLVELAGKEIPALAEAARRLTADAGALDTVTITDAAHAAAVWRIREDGAGLSSRTPAGRPAHAGWEDAAVPPDRLGAYLREFEELLREHRLTGLPYGHFGDGCVHIRIDFPLDAPGGPAALRKFLHCAGELAARHGGSMSGEHGDGRARAQLLPLMYSAPAIGLFARIKALFDPDSVLNPGVIVRPDPPDAAIRVAEARPVRRKELPGLGLAYRHDRGDLSMAVHRCTGVGKCRADTSGQGGVMCPSFLATREEKDSTRGRARVLQDVVAGRLGPDGWRSAALREALDLCLACKGCSADCPTGVDLAAYKAEALHQAYRGRLRPRSHYTLGWLPRWTRLLGRSPTLAGLANRALRAQALRPLLARALGIDGRRALPAFAAVTFRHWFAHRRPAGEDASPAPEESAPLVVLFVDTFTDAFDPEVGQAAVAVLEAAGHRVTVTDRPVCCGLTWISTGQLDTARQRVRAAVRALAPHVRAGARIVGLEPSCTAVLRADAVELLDGDDAAVAAQVAGATRTLAELLSETSGFALPDLAGVTAVAQPHCHHHAVLGWDADAALLRAAGVRVRRLDGCCGLAGNFGLERGHHDISVAVAEQHLLPAARRAAPDEVILADGFSCRTQLHTLSDRTSRHLAQLLADGLAAGAGPGSGAT